MGHARRKNGQVVAVALLAALAAALPSVAQSVIVPGSYSTLDGGGTLNSLTREFTRTFQQAIPGAELASIPKGAWITGMSFRSATTASNAATWPPATATWQNYDITLAEAAVPIANFTTTCATNMKNPVQVRKGKMVVPAGAWSTPNTGPIGVPNPFDEFYCQFDMPYQYQGGDLVFYITHDGNDQASALYLEYISTSTYTAGWGKYASTYQAATVTTGAYFHITRFYYGYAPTYWAGTGGFPPILILNQSLVAPFSPPGTVNFAVTNGLGGATVYFLVGFNQSDIPLPNGCSLLIFPTVAQIPFSLSGSGAGNGRKDLTLKIPAGAVGAVNVQAAVLDPGAKGGFTGTNGVQFVMRP